MRQSETRRILLLIACFAAVVLVVVVTSIMLLYQTAVDLQLQRLKAAAEVRIRMIEVNVKNEFTLTERRDPLTLSKIEERVVEEMRQVNESTLHNNIGTPVEFIWGRLDGDEIKFMLHLLHSKAASIPLHSYVGEPLRRAIEGQLGTMIGLDYRGEKVLSAYAPLNILGRHYGIVTKIDMAEVRAPFIRVEKIVLLLAVAAILAGTFVFLRISNPILRKVQESETMFRGLVEQSIVGIYIIQNERFLYVNPRFAEIFGYDSQAGLIGRPVFELVYADDHNMCVEIIRKRIQGGASSVQFCLRGVKADNKIVHMEIHIARTIMNEQPAIVGVMLDITKRVEDERVIRQLEIAKETAKAKDKLLSMTSHELRTPLSAISGYSQTLLSAHLQGWLAQKEEMLPDLLDRMIQSSLLMGAIIDDILEYSKVEVGNVVIEYDPVDLVQVMDIAKLNLSLKIDAKELTLNIQIPADLPLIHAGLKQCIQILINLIGNAIKFTDKKGTISVRAKAQEDVVIVNVEDSGIGMNEETMKHIFEMFWRSDSVRSIVGTGLGLSLAKLLVETMGGKIWVKSKVGAGSTFHFTLRQWGKDGHY